MLSQHKQGIYFPCHIPPKTCICKYNSDVKSDVCVSGLSALSYFSHSLHRHLAKVIMYCNKHNKLTTSTTDIRLKVLVLLQQLTSHWSVHNSWKQCISYKTRRTRKQGKISVFTDLMVSANLQVGMPTYQAVSGNELKRQTHKHDSWIPSLLNKTQK